MAESLSSKQELASSILVTRSNFAAVAERLGASSVRKITSVRFGSVAPLLKTSFEFRVPSSEFSVWSRNSKLETRNLVSARVAQLTERWSYKPEDEGLNPSLGTITKPFSNSHFSLFCIRVFEFQDTQLGFGALFQSALRRMRIQTNEK